MSVHDHHNDPNDPINRPGKRSGPADPNYPSDPNPGMNSGVWIAAIAVAVLVIGGIIYGMSGDTTTATNESAPAGSQTTTGSGAAGSGGTSSPPPANTAPKQ